MTAVHISEKFEHLLEAYRHPDGRKWTGAELEEATGGAVPRAYVSNLRKGRIESPGYEKLRAIAEALGFPPELWFGDVEKLEDMPGDRSSWFLSQDDKPALLDEEVVEALRDETARAVLREVIRLPEEERVLVLRIVRQFDNTGA